MKERVLSTIALLLIVCVYAGAQTPASTQATPAPSQAPPAPQVITVLHRINGFKMLRLLLQSGEAIGAFESPDDVMKLKGVHTNIIAGLALDDGETIAAWLPEAEVEAGSIPPNAVSPAVPSKAVPVPSTRPSPRPTNPPMAFADVMAERMFERPDITVVERNGERYTARYIGLDGVTGLSLMKLPRRNLPSIAVQSEIELTVGQRLRLFSPEPVSESPATTNNAIYVRLGESQGEVVTIARTTSGEINRIKIKATRLSPANIGAVVVNEKGQTVGIVESVEGNEANVLAPAAIRGAVERVLANHSSVPRPWLGVSGEPVAFASVDRFVTKGWEMQRAKSLLAGQRGILLNSVTPSSPAAVAALREGDVITEVNNFDVRDVDDFSQLLAEAATKPVRFTVVRPGVDAPESIVVNLNDSSNSRILWNRMTAFRGRALPGNPLADQGVETVALRVREPQMKSRRLLVVYVYPDSAPAKAGLQVGDVIEGIDGKPVSLVPRLAPKTTSTSYTLSIERDKTKLLLKVQTSNQQNQ